ARGPQRAQRRPCVAPILVGGHRRGFGSWEPNRSGDHASETRGRAGRSCSGRAARAKPSGFPCRKQEAHCATHVGIERGELAMRKTVLVIAFLLAFAAPAAAQKAQIETINAKWMELFNKGDFAGIAELYTADAVAFPPGAAMVRGK